MAPRDALLPPDGSGATGFSPASPRAATGSPIMREHTLARCRSCNAWFIPVTWVEWREHGYCSELCLQSVLGALPTRSRG